MNYRKTKLGLASEIIRHQRQTSKKRNHPAPNYSLCQFRLWLMSQELYHILFENWEKSGYKRDLIPSVDRIKNDKPYSFDNIQLMTLEQNVNKAAREMICGKLINRHIQIIQIDKNTLLPINKYCSLMDAYRKTGIDFSHISKVLNGKLKSTGGFYWRYLVKENDPFVKM